MEDKHLRKAFEETTNKNIKAVIIDNKQTKIIVDNLNKKINNLESQILQQNTIIDMLKIQLSSIQKIIFNKGSV